MTVWFSFVLAAISLTFGWQVYRAFSQGFTAFPLSLLAMEEFDRESIYFWGVVVLNLVGAVAFAAAAVLAYLHDWGSLTA